MPNNDSMEYSSDRSASPKGLPPQSPDLIEQDFPDEIDNIVPSQGYQMLPMVGLGGSAGSIGALQRFFEKVPSETGMAFVVILHLSPEHSSILPEVLARCTSMPVRPARDGVSVEANSVYVIPPGKHLSAVNGHLQLRDLAPEKGCRIAVDYFFRSLADTHGPHAAAVVLSGADSDGAIGIKRVKERGGLTIAQDPDEAEQRAMPQAAIATAMVDWILKVEEMPKRLVDYFASEQRLRIPPEEGPHPAPAPSEEAIDQDEVVLRELLSYLRTRSGCDFSYYKRATIVRRIARRMQVNGVTALPEYLSIMRTLPGETRALLQDLLISVTNFFRDRDAFHAFESHLPKLFTKKGPSDSVRVWVPGCATGEEAYSIAMLLIEHAGTLEQAPAIQVFGCDLDEEAIGTARTAVYPSCIDADVDELRLRRFFIRDQRGYRVGRELREVVLFATHDLLRDAPFSRMDLVSCRNLLIYLNRDAQKRALDLFHFALRPAGLLLLGSSESVPEPCPLFDVVDKKHRLYRQHPTPRPTLPAPVGTTLARALAAQEKILPVPMLPGRSFVAPPPAESDRPTSPIAGPELHFKLLERYAAPSVLVNKDYEIIHVSENGGRFLRISGGEGTLNLLRVVDPMLRAEVRTALFEAAESGNPVHIPNVPFHFENSAHAMDLRVVPAGELGPGYFLVVFEVRAGGAEANAATSVPATQPHSALQHLEREIEATRARLRATEEENDANIEEMKASNEELQAMNEELRSASEELETSREELQSINEELSTVNQELKGKVDELSLANSNLHNLMSATAIATVFLDLNLRIMLFTPSALSIFRIIPTDVGRPLADLQHQLDYPELTHDAQRVLAQLTPMEREVRDTSDHVYLARLLPYRTLEESVDGVVLTFVDVTERHRAEQALRRSQERLRLLVESAKDYAIFSMDSERLVDTWNTGAQLLFGYTEKEIIGQSGDVLFTPEDRQHGAPQREAQTALAQGQAENERWHLRKNQTRFYGSGSVMPLRDSSGTQLGFVKIMRDLTEKRKAEQEIAQKARLLDLTQDAIIAQRLDGTITLWNKGAEMLYGWSSAEVLGKPLQDFLKTEYPISVREILAQVRAGTSFTGDVVQRARDGRRIHSLCRWVWDPDSELVLTSYMDISERKRAEELARKAQEQLERQAGELERLVQEKTESLQQAVFQMEEFSYTVSHDLRAPLRAMQSFARALLEDYGDGFEGEAKEYLERIEAAARRMEELTRDVLAYIKVSKGEPQTAPVSLQEVLREILSLAPSLSKAVSIEGPLPSVIGEKPLLSQAISNLLDNAVKFVRPGVPPRIRVWHESKGRRVRLWIEDNGIGIDPAHQSRLFRAFERLRPNEGYEGSGIGLAIVRKAVERMAGQVGVESDGKTGSRFWIELVAG